MIADYDIVPREERGNSRLEQHAKDGQVHAVRRWRSSPAAVSARHVNHCEDTPVRIATGYVSVAPGRGIYGRVPD